MTRFWAAHDALYQGGAEAGLRHRHRGLRLYITKLWGTENGGQLWLLP